MIQIHILRISADAQFLEMHVECPSNYTFNFLEITRYDPVTKQDLTPIDLSIALKKTSNVEILRLATSLLGSDVTMYKVSLGTIRNTSIDTEAAVGYCSNINFVYTGMLDLIMQLTASCINTSDFDTLNRNHMILYAHQEAMRLGRIADAKFFYNIIWKQFSWCGNSGRIDGVNTTNCNCT